MQNKVLEITTKTEAETEAVGEKLALILKAGDVVCLSGDLGTGKTTMVRGIVRGLGIGSRVHSPTFNIANEYGGGRVVHLDAYRLNSADEMLDAGYEDYIDRGAIMLIEWPERIIELIPESAMRVEIARSPETRDGRIIRIRPAGDAV